MSLTRNAACSFALLLLVAACGDSEPPPATPGGDGSPDTGSVNKPDGGHTSSPNNDGVCVLGSRSASPSFDDASAARMR